MGKKTKKNDINLEGIDPKTLIDPAILKAAMKVNPDAVDSRIAKEQKKKAKKKPD